MNVLSLFDGMSCGMVALERAGIEVDKYYASEIDKYAIKVSEANYPSIKRLGDVKSVKACNLNKIDLLIGGSPCQGFSFAGKQLNFGDPRSQLFFEFVKILKECQAINPDVKFMLENVKMKKEYQDIISNLLGVEPIEINSSLVSAQNRKRLYWTNIEGIKKPEDKVIVLKNILEKSVGAKYYLSEKLLNGFSRKYERYLQSGSKSGFGRKLIPNEASGKSFCLTSRYYKMGVTDPYVKDLGGIRKLTPVECERLQTVPDNYTKQVSNTQRYKMLGNGWTVDVIAHIFKNLKQEQ